ncbi:hypothetical protein [Wolbachia pipientis]|nr:hypothetical protein [Wolbachia pipientis]
MPSYQPEQGLEFDYRLVTHPTSDKTLTQQIQDVAIEETTKPIAKERKKV